MLKLNCLFGETEATIKFATFENRSKDGAMNESNQGVAQLEQNIVLLLNKLKDNHYTLETLRQSLTTI